MNNFKTGQIEFYSLFSIGPHNEDRTMHSYRFISTYFQAVFKVNHFLN